MDIDGVGERLVRRLLDARLIAQPQDIYRLSVDDLLPLEGFQERSATNVIESIETSKQRPFARVLFGLGIPHVGFITAELLADFFGSVEALGSATAEEIAGVEGIGPVIAEAVSGWFVDEEHQEVVRALKEAGVQMEGPRRERAAGGGPLEGVTFVVTGSIEGFTRDGIRDHLESLGAKVTDSVSRKTDYVLAGEGGGSKRAKAEALDVPIIGSEDLEELVSSRQAAAG
jgi:DNA ligase (NAD+)